MKNIAGQIRKEYWLFIILLATFAIRIPSLFEPLIYGDEGVYMTIGLAIRRGLVLYRDIYDNKPPLIYLIAAIAKNFSTYRSIAMAFNLLAIAVFYRLAEKVLEKKAAVIASTAVLALMTGLRTLEGNIANAENFFLLPTILAMAIIIPGKKKKANSLLWLLSGLLFGLSALFKIPALFDFAAFLCFLIIYKISSFKKICLAVVGFSLPFLATTISLASFGSARQFIEAAILQNIPYLSSWIPHQAKVANLPIGLILRGIIVLASVATVIAKKRRFPLAASLAVILFSFSLFASLLSSRPYPHYLLQTVPAIAISSGLIFLKKRSFSWIPIVFSLTILTIMIRGNFYSYKNYAYYRNFFRFICRLESKEQYLNFFDNKASDVLSTANLISNQSQKGDKIFVWGDYPFLYAIADRLPVGKYTAAYHINEKGAREETIAAINSAKPVFIILPKQESCNFPELSHLAKNNYLQIEGNKSFQIFKRINFYTR